MLEVIGQEEATALYEVKDVVSLLVNSFRFSRGYASAQYAILEFIGHTFGDRFGDAAILDEALLPSQEAASAIYTNRGLHPHREDGASEKSEADVREQVDDEVKSFMFALASYVDDHGRGDLDGSADDELCNGLISADYNWVPENRNLSSLSLAPVRPYSSNLVANGFLERSVGRPEFDTMFQRASQLLLQGFEEIEWDVGSLRSMERVQSIVNAHLLVQPEDATPLGDALAETNLGTIVI